jgi:hypothetical protein
MLVDEHFICGVHFVFRKECSDSIKWSKAQLFLCAYVRVELQLQLFWILAPDEGERSDSHRGRFTTGSWAGQAP